MKNPSKLSYLLFLPFIAVVLIAPAYQRPGTAMKRKQQPSPSPVLLRTNTYMVPMPDGSFFKQTVISRVSSQTIVQPTNGQLICITNWISPNGKTNYGTRCYVYHTYIPYTALAIPFMCVTNASNHSYVQSSPDLQHWTHIPAALFGYTNFNESNGTYLFGSSNQFLFLLIPNWTNLPHMFYRIHYVD
jgi:hypothetical protein